MFYIFVLLSKIFKNYLKKLNSDKILRWKFVVRILIDQVIVTSVLEGLVLHLNKLEFPPPKDALCQVRLKLA